MDEVACTCTLASTPAVCWSNTEAERVCVCGGAYLVSPKPNFDLMNL